MLPRKALLSVLFGLAYVLASVIMGCQVAESPGDGSMHRWWSGLGPVLPHDSFPADCSICHLGRRWNELREDFVFDHERETGHALKGAHKSAQCLRCHNDRGPVQSFEAQGCRGCHEDFHQGTLGPNCASCHDEVSWKTPDMVARHNRTRMPLTGAHLATACHRCHEGAWVGKFRPVDANCVTCHQADLQKAINPPHLGLGWVDRCDRCHIPTDWNQARTR